MITLYGARYKCDSCGKEADGIIENMVHRPPSGWARKLEYIMSSGVPLHDLCDICMALPFSVVIKNLADRLEGK